MTTSLRSLFTALAVILLCSCARNYSVSSDGRIVMGDKPYYFVGINMWYAPRLAIENPDRLDKELDLLKSIGVNNIRVLATESDWDAYDALLPKLEERDMTAVMFINNAWEWSKGFAKYLEEAGAGKQPRPLEDGYSAYMKAMAAFSTNEKARQLSFDYLKTIVSRYKDSHAIFSWQIANEPRCFSSDTAVKNAFVDYIHQAASLIKSIDRNHMVSTGNEGLAGCENDIELFRRINESKDVDYVTIHIWPLNWSWIKSDDVTGGVNNAISKINEYINVHLQCAHRMGKSVVIEEFGYPRDGFCFTPGSPDSARVSIYETVFNRILSSARKGGNLAGANFWAWGGYAAPSHVYWQEGDDYCGDPFQEQQGLNSVFACDSAMISLIRSVNLELSQAAPVAQPASCTKETASDVMDCLLKSVQAGKYLYGHQDDLSYGHSWRVEDAVGDPLDRSDVYDVCGDYPAVLGLDLGGIEMGDSLNLDGVDFRLMRRAALKHAARGGIVTFSWHLRNPLTGGDAWDVTDATSVAACLEGGAVHDKFTGWLDKLADFIGSLDIPVIFRPWHEHTESWFWWGKDLCSPAQYNELWKMTYDYLTRVRGLDNMIWAISPCTMSEADTWEERYPGDEYVDIVGVDSYGAGASFSSRLDRSLELLGKFCLQHNKVLAVTETGSESIPDAFWWCNDLMPALEKHPVSYVLTWRNAPDRENHFYAPFPGSGKEQGFNDFYHSDKTSFTRDIQ